MMAHMPWRKPANWIGLRPFQRHGLVLTVAGGVYIAYGLTYLLVPLDNQRRNGLEVALWFSSGSIATWGITWILVGFLALSSTRWPRFSHLWGYIALSFLGAIWALQYAAGLVLLHTSRINIAAAIVWGLVTFLWWAISGLRNPDQPAPPAPSDTG